MGGGAAGDGEGHDEGLPALCLGDGGGGVPIREEGVEGVNKLVAGDVLALEFFVGVSISCEGVGGHLTELNSDNIARGGGGGGGGDGGPPEECEEEGVGGDCAIGMQEGSCEGTCEGTACHVLAMACVGGGFAVGEEEGDVLVGGCDGRHLEESEEGFLVGGIW